MAVVFKEASHTLLQILAGFGAASLCGDPMKTLLSALKSTHSHTLKIFMLLYADDVFAALYKHERALVTLLLHKEGLLRSSVPAAGGISQMFPGETLPRT